MKLLTVPNWSFGRNKALLHRFEETIGRFPLELHYLQGDVDHNRTVSAFSGDFRAVYECLLELAEAAFDAIDLNRHTGVHPRIGALDVCPFVPLGEGPGDLTPHVEVFARTLAERFALPVYLYEKSERGRHEADLPSLRRGGFGGLLERELHPDFGPLQAHNRLGVTVVGVRDFLIAMNVDLDIADPSAAKQFAARIRQHRIEGDPRFLGVRALGFPLASRELTQVSMNLTLPDLTPVDPILEWVRTEAQRIEVGVTQNELIGVIRAKDVSTATRLPIRPEQVIPAV